MKRTHAAVVAVGLLALAAGGGAVTHRVATAPETLVALGDSYASGTGTGTYVASSGDCQRSRYAHPAIIARDRGVQLTFEACAGGTIDSVRADQLPAVTQAADTITLSVGGNDVGFAPIMYTCSRPSLVSDCSAAIDYAQAEITSELPGRLDALYREVKERAPGARVVVTGYPRLFMGTDCNAGTWFSSAEQVRLNATADQLNEVTRAQATRHGFSFVDPTEAFIGHAVCDEREWINGLSEPVAESFHPNRRGQAAYARLVTAALD